KRAGRSARSRAGSDAPDDALGLRQEEARVTLEGAFAFPLVIKEVEYCLRGASRLFSTKGIECRPCQAQAVLDSFVGNVSLGEVMNELWVDALESSAVTLFDLFCVPAM